MEGKGDIVLILGGLKNRVRRFAEAGGPEGKVDQNAAEPSKPCGAGGGRLGTGFRGVIRPKLPRAGARGLRRVKPEHFAGGA